MSVFDKGPEIECKSPTGPVGLYFNHFSGTRGGSSFGPFKMISVYKLFTESCFSFHFSSTRGGSSFGPFKVISVYMLFNESCYSSSLSSSLLT